MSAAPYLFKVTNTSNEYKKVVMFNGKENLSAVNYGNDACIVIENEYPNTTYVTTLPVFEQKPLVVESIFCTVRQLFTFTKKRGNTTETKTLIAYPFPHQYDQTCVVEIDNETEMSFIMPPCTTIHIDIVPAISLATKFIKK